jgi:hypothetical protein
MITTTLGQLVEADAALQRLATLKSPCATAYRLAKLCKVVSDETRLFYQQRLALIQEHGTERPATPEEAARGETTMWQVKPDQMAAYVGKLQPLAAEPVTLAVQPLELQGLGAIEVSAAELLALGPLLADPDEEKAGTP